MVKIGAKEVRHGRYVTFQLAEVAVSRSLFQHIVELINDLRRRPVSAQAEEINGEVKSTEKLFPDDERNDQMAFQAWADYQNLAIGWLQRGCSSLGGGMVVHFP